MTAHFKVKDATVEGKDAATISEWTRSVIGRHGIVLDTRQGNALMYSSVMTLRTTKGRGLQAINSGKT
jgi:hypothetical protein